MYFRLFWLVILELQKNEIEIISDDNFEKLSSLTYLYLGNNKIKIVSNYSFNNLRKLNCLNLTNNQIRNIDYRAFIGTCRIVDRCFDIRNNPVAKSFTYSKEKCEVKSNPINEESKSEDIDQAYKYNSRLKEAEILSKNVKKDQENYYQEEPEMLSSIAVENFDIKNLFIMIILKGIIIFLF